MVNMCKELSVGEKVLLAITRKRDKTHYQLWAKDKVAKSNKTVLNVLGALEKLKLIEFKEEKTGRKRKPYNITHDGLIATLKCKQAFAHIDEIAEAQKDTLPLIFGKWPFFKEKGILTYIIERLQITITQLWARLYLHVFTPKDLYELYFFKRRANNEVKTHPKDFKAITRPQKPVFLDINAPVLGLDTVWLLPPDTEWAKKQKKFLQILMEDPDLQNYITSFFESNSKTINGLQQKFGLWKRWWEKMNVPT